MRTTIRLEDDLIERVKRYAVDRGQTFTTVVREALVAYLARAEGARGSPVKRNIDLPVSGKGGTLPGVDLDDSADLADIMDGRE